MTVMRPEGDAMTPLEADCVETIIIGGGQAGLSAAYHLRRKGRPFLVLDAGERTGDAWRDRWDSLHLFTPALYSSLPGMHFPAPAWSFPTKDEMGDYLESYAEHFGLAVRSGVSVHELTREGDRFCVSAGDLRLEASNVIVATGALTGSRRSRCSRRSSIRGSCSFTRSNTATPASCSRETRCSWARATRGPRSPTSSRIPGTASSQARVPDRFPFATALGGAAWAFGRSGSSPITWSGSTRGSVAALARSSPAEASR